MDTVREMHNDFRNSFPEISSKVDEDQKSYLDEVGLGTPFFWFECLAMYINKEMIKEVDAREFKIVFEYFRTKYLFCGEHIKECIDVSFTENLFHNVSAGKAEQYWELLPDLLKDLYINFHHRTPV
jgi:hypothetical protein